ncbi:hypothetical protein GCM10023116_46530 [Kistimonas scapharcae]|uniref:Uncharacterized protein n=1 Tax=Kistimonas scapharcae TaxID=1036133 RepID=A0ABP8VA27_9GAMM
MDNSPYEKLCRYFLGDLPVSVRGRPRKGKATTKDLAVCLGIRHETILRWPLVTGTHERVIPPRSAKTIERLSNGAVKAEEIREYASQHQSGEAA